MQEEFILFSLNKAFKKIKVPKVLNWDSTGHTEMNIVNIGRDERRRHKDKKTSVYTKAHIIIE